MDPELAGYVKTGGLGVGALIVLYRVLMFMAREWAANEKAKGIATVDAIKAVSVSVGSFEKAQQAHQVDEFEHHTEVKVTMAQLALKVDGALSSFVNTLTPGEQPIVDVPRENTRRTPARGTRAATGTGKDE